jgi:NADH-quinone oxidoreductase subunit G
MSLHAVHDDWAMPVAATLTAAPSQWLRQLAEVAAAVAQERAVPAPWPADAGPHAQAVASAAPGSGQGGAAGQRRRAASASGALLAVAQWIAEQTGASCGYLGETANGVGAQLVGAQPGPGGLHAGQMLSQPMKALLLLNTEPVLDSRRRGRRAAGAGRVGSGRRADAVQGRRGRRGRRDAADRPFTETAGSFVNAEGRLQAFHGVVKPLGDTRPAWKVLRVLGNLLGLPGFDQESVDDVRRRPWATAPCAGRTAWTTAARRLSLPGAAAGLERVADVPIYASDAIVRRAPCRCS